MFARLFNNQDTAACNNFKMTHKKTFKLKQSHKNKRFTAYLLLIIISINSSNSLPIAQNNNSKYINLKTGSLDKNISRLI